MSPKPNPQQTDRVNGAPSNLPRMRPAPNWRQRVGIALAGIVVAVGGFIGGFMVMQKAHQQSTQVNGPEPLPEQFQSPTNPQDIMSNAIQYQEVLTALQNKGGAALSENPRATFEEHTVAFTTEAYYQTIDRESEALQGTTRDWFDLAAQTRETNETVFEEAFDNLRRSDPQSAAPRGENSIGSSQIHRKQRNRSIRRNILSY